VNKHEGDKRQFTQLSRAWYADANLPENGKVEIITIGFYCPGGGTSGEFEVSWSYLGGRLVPKLRAYDDSWSALYEFSDLLDCMAGVDGRNITPDEFCKLLVNLGIEDATRTKQP